MANIEITAPTRRGARASGRANGRAKDHDLDAMDTGELLFALRAFRRGDSRGLLPCPAATADSNCAVNFVRGFGRKAFRRPLTGREIARYNALFAAQKDAIQGAQMVIETMLQSPNFLFWLDSAPNPSWKPYATASRLSYFLWNTMPDEGLLDSAASGELDTSEGLERVTRRMLADPKARSEERRRERV